MITAAPSDLLCLFCALGAGDVRQVARSGRQARRLRGLLAVAKADPTAPVRLRCAVDSVYAYQNPRSGEAVTDAEARRDLRVLQRLGLVPGDARPAIELLRRSLECIPSVEGVCDRLCPHASQGSYAVGRELGIEAVCPPRATAEMAKAKEKSVRAMREAPGLSIRPHHLMCMACFHAGQDSLAPIAEDNLCEAIRIVQGNPEVPITLARGCCMICPPCPSYQARTNRCIGDIGMSLRDEKKDLDLLAILGLRYGDTLPARELFGLLFHRVVSTRQVCGYGDGILRAREWRVCGGEDGDPRYQRAREGGLGIPGKGEGTR